MRGAAGRIDPVRPRDLHALEFDQVCRRLSEFAASPGGQDACRTLAPVADPVAATAALAAVDQCYRLTESHGALPLAAFHDVRAALHSATHPGFALDGKTLVEVLGLLETAHSCRAYIDRYAAEQPAVRTLGERIDPADEIRATLARSLDPDGNVTDDASDELAEVRETVRRVRARLARRLEAMLEQPEVADVLSDKFVTLRNNRYVLPVRTAAAPQFAGVIQDRSVSGETTFIEPPFAVELNNELLIAAREEERIVHRILSDLTAMLGGAVERLHETYAALVELDVLHARAAFARMYRCTQPTFDDREVDIRAARHPVLLFAGRDVVPVDISLPAGKCVLVVTGPNTGGKTVALKTAGLLALMAQAGLPIPAAEGSRLPCFQAIFADVGDEQSIERDLSTFSGHLANLKDIFDRHTAPSLVLLDEPGVGTDPEEGAALGIGLIGELADLGARVVVTTHYAALKAHALREDRCITAAVSFDMVGMKPTYQLVYHSVGESLAVAIARRLGLPERVLRAAEGARSEQARAFAEAMHALEDSRRRYEQRLAELDATVRASREREAEAARLVEDLRGKRAKHWQAELQEARAFVREVRERGRQILAGLEGGTATRRTLDAFAREELAAIAAQAVVEAPGPDAAQTAVAVGDSVTVAGTQLSGVLVSIGPERAWIQRGTMRFEVPREGLRRVADHPPTASQGVRIHVERPAAGSPIELSLLGLRVKDALSRLDTFLDRAARDGVPSVRIIHGVGSGALRRAVAEYLDACPYCASFRLGGDGEGGAGATIAELGA